MADDASESSRKYRPDIDGLRAIAVVSVLLFHAELGLGGGFVGVDVFFVISGYLITQVIAGDLARGEFSIAIFYERRIRRIFPALFAMLAFCAVVGWLIFLPRDFEKLGANIVGATAFVSNIFFWEQTDYFDGPAEMKPLLHTWSLAVEEQFYILFPLLLIVARRWFGDRWALLIWPLALASFGLSLWMVAAGPSAAFYLTPFRAWELLLGALLALGAVPSVRSQLWRDALSVAGLALILWAVLRFSDQTLFPGVNALFPCFGAAFIIHAGTGGSSLAGRLLGRRPFVAIGRMSYSLYLWHWPLIVFAGYVAIDALSLWQSLGLVALSFAVAALSWRYIEVPFLQRNAAFARAPLFAAASSATIAAFALGGAIVLANGLPGRFSPRVDALSDYVESVAPDTDGCGSVRRQLAADSPCAIGDARHASVFLWGDSHAAALYGAFHELAEDGISTAWGATPRCPPLVGIGTDRECIRGNSRRLAYILAHDEIETVVIAARWALYLEGRAVDFGPAETNGNLPELIDRRGESWPLLSEESHARFRAGLSEAIMTLLGAGKKVVLVYPIPETGYDIPSTLARMADQGEDFAAFTRPARLYHKRQQVAFDLLDSVGRHPRLTRIYPERALCHKGQCWTYAGNAPLYFDSHHLSLPGARLLLPQLRSALERSL
jgi:peptidoglycan/LPS O-acetylase OafA/YrhL